MDESNVVGLPRPGGLVEDDPLLRDPFAEHLDLRLLPLQMPPELLLIGAGKQEEQWAERKRRDKPVWSWE